MDDISFPVELDMSEFDFASGPVAFETDWIGDQHVVDESQDLGSLYRTVWPLGSGREADERLFATSDGWPENQLLCPSAYQHAPELGLDFSSNDIDGMEYLESAGRDLHQSGSNAAEHHESFENFHAFDGHSFHQMVDSSFSLNQDTFEVDVAVPGQLMDAVPMVGLLPDGFDAIFPAENIQQQTSTENKLDSPTEKNAEQTPSLGVKRKRARVSSARKPRRPRPKLMDAIRDYDEAKGMFIELSPKMSAAHVDDPSKKDRNQRSREMMSSQTRVNGACFKCRDRKRACTGSLERCDHCIAVNALCVRAHNIFPNLPPDVYSDFSIPIQQPLISLTLPRIWNVYIVARGTSGSYINETTPLLCKVYEREPRISNMLEVPEPKLWEDLRSRNGGKEAQRISSCEILSGGMPSADKLQEWAVSSVREYPFHIAEPLFAPLYDFSSVYIRSRQEPERNLLSLALTHVSIYNVCYSNWYISFLKRPDAFFLSSPRIRAQLSAALSRDFERTGIKLQEEIDRIFRRHKRPPTEQHLTICLVLWLLIVVYKHSLDEVDRAAECLPVGNPIRSSLPARRIRLQYLKSRIQESYQALFCKSESDICPIFDEELQKPWDLEQGDAFGWVSLHALQEAMRNYEDLPHRRDGNKIDIATLIGPVKADVLGRHSLEQRALFGWGSHAFGISEDSQGYIGIRAPPPSANTLDTMSMETLSFKGVKEFGGLDLISNMS